MKNTSQKHIIALSAAVAIGLYAFGPLQAETLTFKPVENNRTKVTLEGTSNVRDWDAESVRIEGSIEVQTDGLWGESGFNPAHLARNGGAAVSATVQIRATSLDTDSSRLTSNLHDYLKAGTHPFIRFELSSLELVADNTVDLDNEAESFTTRVEGSLTVSGQTRNIAFPVQWSREGNHLVLEGKTDLKMSNFGIDPPRLMFGALRAADEVTVQFVWVLAPATD